jgi:two-component sensor histidine kinase
MRGIAVDISSRKQMEEDIRHRLAVEELVAGISSRFVNVASDQIESEIVRALGMLGDRMGADRTYFTLFAWGTHTIERELEWSVDGIEPLAPDRIGLSMAPFRWVMGELEQYGVVRVPSVADLPPEASAERDFWPKTAKHAIMGVALRQKNVLAGYLGLSSRTSGVAWSEADVNLLRLVGEIFLNVLARRRFEEQLQASLKEKEMLLREIHHRVKNNLQVVSSLLFLQSEAVGDELPRRALEESQQRVRSLALLHEQMYQSAELATVDFGRYIEGLVYQLRDAYHIRPDTVALVPRVEDVSLGLDAAIPCSLIINELVSNALQHAFPPDWQSASKADGHPEIRITFHPADDGLLLVVSDNGVGLPAEMDLDTVNSLGLRIVQLLTRQLHGTLSVERHGGTTFAITFPRVRTG